MKPNNPETERIFEELTAKAMRMLLEREGIAPVPSNKNENKERAVNPGGEGNSKR